MQVSKVISAPIEVVWRIITDTRLWSVWGPSLSRVECPQRYIAAGVKGQVRTIAGLWAPFEITSFEPPSYWHWKVAGMPATGHRLKKLGKNSCELIFEMPFVAFPYAVICHQATNNIARLAEENVSS